MTAPNDLPAGQDDRDDHDDSFAVDPDAPGVCEFIRFATLEGLIRTAPTGRGWILVLPVGPWPGVGHPADI